MKALVLFVALSLSSTAQAQDYVAFHSPSGNIQCAIFGGDYAGVRCDMGELTQTFRQRPAGCEFDWGFSFGVEPESRKGYLACVSDAVADAAGLELGYGQQISLFGLTCTSEKSGMTCTNPAGHGFSLSKARQDLF